jgi:hypothetical protein
MVDPHRSQIIKQSLLSVTPVSWAKMENFLKKQPPAKEEVEDKDIKELEIIVETTNKSTPYIEIKRSIEVDKDGNPCYGFSLISLGLQDKNREIYLGTFGQDEILQTLQKNSLTNEPPESKIQAEKNTKPKKTYHKNEPLIFGID